MALITFMSDFGYTDHYVAAVKARILQIEPSIHITDISHNIDFFDLAHGSYVLNAVFRDFPLETVHLIGINSFDNLHLPLLALKLEGHFFVGPDNGIFSLISEELPEAVVEINKNEYQNSTFPEKDILAPVAAKLALGTPIHELGDAFDGLNKMIGRKLRATKKQITGHVVRVDHYGNLITNIDKKVFDHLSKDKKFRIILGRESLNQVHDISQISEDGEIFSIFNSKGYLQIGINKGNASELLGIHFDSSINIIFAD